jgi:hypothetical protein
MNVLICKYFGADFDGDQIRTVWDSGPEKGMPASWYTGNCIYSETPCCGELLRASTTTLYWKLIGEHG